MCRAGSSHVSVYMCYADVMLKQLLSMSPANMYKDSLKAKIPSWHCPYDYIFLINIAPMRDREKNKDKEKEPLERNARLTKFLLALQICY